jgi:hypothetical protein
MRVFRCRLKRGVAVCGLWSVVLTGCTSPEDGRPRGGGPGGDGGNYRAKPIHAPSKIDGTKAVANPFPSSDRPIDPGVSPFRL